MKIPFTSPGNNCDTSQVQYEALESLNGEGRSSSTTSKTPYQQAVNSLQQNSFNSIPIRCVLLEGHKASEPTLAMPAEWNIRSAQPSDIPQIRNLFSYYVLNTALSFRVNDPTDSLMLSRYQAAIASGLPYIVATTTKDNEGKESVLGFAHASSFQAGKHAYGHSVEITIFLDRSYTNQGIGSLLMEDLLSRLKTCRHLSIEPGHEDDKREFPVRKVFAIMGVDEDQPNQGLGLRDWYINKWGFEECGRFKGIGEKLGRDSIDTIYLEKHLQ